MVFPQKGFPAAFFGEISPKSDLKIEGGIFGHKFTKISKTFAKFQKNCVFAKFFTCFDRNITK